MDNITTDKDFAQAIDFINDFVIIKGKANLNDIKWAINKKYKYVTFQYTDTVIDVMNDLKYIQRTDTIDNNTIALTEYSRTNKGELLAINGGVLKQVTSEQNKNRFYVIGQISILVAGIYYLLEIARMTGIFAFLFPLQTGC